jgi:hypothetical protein
VSVAEFRIWKKGERVWITMGDRTVDGVVLLASPNGLSLALVFEAILGGYAGMIPAYWDDEAGSFLGLACGQPVTLAELPGRAAEGQEPGGEPG